MRTAAKKKIRVDTASHTAPQSTAVIQDNLGQFTEWLRTSPSSWVAWIGHGTRVFGAKLIISILFGIALGSVGMWAYAVRNGLPFNPSLNSPIEQLDWDVKANFVRANPGGVGPTPLSESEKRQLKGSTVRLFPTAIVDWPSVDEHGQLSFTYKVPRDGDLERELSKIELLDNDNWQGTLIFNRKNDRTEYKGGGVNPGSGDRVRSYYIELTPR